MRLPTVQTAMWQAMTSGAVLRRLAIFAGWQGRKSVRNLCLLILTNRLSWEGDAPVIKRCKWCNEQLDGNFYPDQPSDVCTGCWETIMEEEEFFRVHVGDHFKTTEKEETIGIRLREGIAGTEG